MVARNHLTLQKLSLTKRIVLHLNFDRAVELSDFVKTLPANGELLFHVEGLKDAEGNPSEVTKAVAEKHPAEKVTHILKTDAISITQDGGKSLAIKGLKTIEGNQKAFEVILEEGSKLTNNKNVDVTTKYVSKDGEPTVSTKNFILTDARTPEVTSVTNEGMKKVAVKFSEPITAATISVDAGNSVVADQKIGEFHPATQVDNRNLVTLNMADWLKSGQHGIEVSSTTDFANNVGKTQNLNFTVAANTAKPVAASSEVASPYQFSIFFNAPVLKTDADKYEVEVYDEANDRWESLNEFLTTEVKPVVGEDNTAIQFNQEFESRISNDGKELVIEAKNDWQELFQTTRTEKDFHNYEYRVVYAKEALVNQDNGLKNDRFTVELSTGANADSALTKPDTTSPAIEDIIQVSANEYEVTLSEPVLLGGNETAEFVGTGKNGETVTIKAPNANLW